MSPSALPLRARVRRLRAIRPGVFVVTLSLGLLLATTSQAVVVTFNLNPAQSSGDFELTGLVSGGGPFVPATQPQTQSAALRGTLVLDVTTAGGVVQSVDFVSLTADYDVSLASPFDWLLTYLPGILGTTGTETVRLVSPFDPLLNCGNPVTAIAPRISLAQADAGVETGTGGGLTLTDPIFGYEGTAQYFDDELPLNPSCDGFPFQLGPFPTIATWTGGPPSANTLSGTVTIQPSGQLAFSGTYAFSGVGGVGGGVRSGQVHTGTLVAAEPPPVPALGAWGVLGLLSGVVVTGALRVRPRR